MSIQSFAGGRLIFQHMKPKEHPGSDDTFSMGIFVMKTGQSRLIHLEWEENNEQ